MLRVACHVSFQYILLLELAKEQAEFEEVSKANAELAAQATLLQQRHSALQRQNDQIDAEIASESKSKEFFHLPAFLAVLEQQEAVLKAQESQLMQLCEQFERRLGLEIVSSNGKCGVILSQSSVTETDGSTSTTLIYTLIDPNDWDRKFIVQFSTNTGDFFISKCEPMLPQLASLIEEMRSDRNIFNFVKKVRQAFQLCNFK